MQPQPMQIDLSQLKDVHLGLKPDFWPLASGWYILFACILAIILIIFYLYKRYKRLPLPYALKELEKIKKSNSEDQLKLLNQLLKRVAMVKYDRREIAPLVEDRWIDFLQASAPNTLTKKQAHELAFSIYSKYAPDAQLYKNCQKWIKTTLKKH